MCIRDSAKMPRGAGPRWGRHTPIAACLQRLSHAACGAAQRARRDDEAPGGDVRQAQPPSSAPAAPSQPPPGPQRGGASWVRQAQPLGVLRPVPAPPRRRRPGPAGRRSRLLRLPAGPPGVPHLDRRSPGRRDVPMARAPGGQGQPPRPRRGQMQGMQGTESEEQKRSPNPRKSQAKAKNTPHLHSERQGRPRAPLCGVPHGRQALPSVVHENDSSFFSGGGCTRVIFFSGRGQR